MNTEKRYSTERMGEPQTLLVVDDDPVFQELKVQMLSDEGYTVLRAADAEEALRLARTKAVDLLLTDFWLNETDPLELTWQFRELHPQTPVLMVSDFVPWMYDRAENLERFAILEKPFTFDALLQNVRALLDLAAPLPVRNA